MRLPAHVVGLLDQVAAAISDRGWAVLHGHGLDGGAVVWVTCGLTALGLPELYLIDTRGAVCPGHPLTLMTDGWGWDVLDQAAAAVAYGPARVGGVAVVRCGGRDAAGVPVDDEGGPLLVRLELGDVDQLGPVGVLYPGAIVGAVQILAASCN